MHFFSLNYFLFESILKLAHTFFLFFLYLTDIHYFFHAKISSASVSIYLAEEARIQTNSTIINFTLVLVGLAVSGSILINHFLE